MRPSSMYIDAAKRAGATRISSVCMIYGPSVQSGVSLCERARPTYPTVSTGWEFSNVRTYGLRPPPVV